MADSKVQRPRMRYVARACSECKRRKIKCSGDQPCRACRNSIYRVCSYDSNGRKAKRTTASCTSPDMTSSIDSPLASRLTPVEQSSLGSPNPRCSLRAKISIAQSAAPNLDVHDEEPSTPMVMSCLSPNQELGKALQCYFDELETFYPCFDRADFYTRLSRLFIEHSIVKDNTTLLPMSNEHLSLAAVTCAMACLGVYLGGAADKERMPDYHYTTAAWKWHAESHRLLDMIPKWKENPNLDIICLHMLEVVWMIIQQGRAEQSRLMATAVDLALDLKLHDEEAWAGLDPSQREHTRLLWWTLCFMDRRVALTIGRPVFISTVAVDEPNQVSEAEWMKESPIEMSNNSSSQLLSLDWPKPAARTQTWVHYVLFIVRWSKLYGDISNRFFTPQCSTNEVTVVEKIAMTDIMLLQLRRDLPANLLWDAVQLPISVPLGDRDRVFRMRLIIYEAINFLRIRVRKAASQSSEDSLSALDDTQSLKTVGTIATDLLDAVAVYLGSRKSARPWSTYGSILVMEVASHVIAGIHKLCMVPEHLMTGQRRALACIASAHDCLDGIDVKHAVQATNFLGAVLQSTYGVSLSTLPPQIFAKPPFLPGELVAYPALFAGKSRLLELKDDPEAYSGSP